MSIKVSGGINMAITTFKRYEKKFLLNETQYKSILPGLLQFMSIDEHCKDSHEYTISNVYYDTDNSSIIRNHFPSPTTKKNCG
jgi:hypothetical protein